MCFRNVHKLPNDITCNRGLFGKLQHDRTHIPKWGSAERPSHQDHRRVQVPFTQQSNLAVIQRATNHNIGSHITNPQVSRSCSIVSDPKAELGVSQRCQAQVMDRQAGWLELLDDLVLDLHRHVHPLAVSRLFCHLHGIKVSRRSPELVFAFQHLNKDLLLVFVRAFMCLVPLLLLGRMSFLHCVSFLLDIAGQSPAFCL
mmetsp:Transcript_18373/g.42547  ORF Transcript_18373/g.42547 Transcript_18373/m.42547 type:complete len:200 (-) Transcript_18373:1127-1726(-)